MYHVLKEVSTRPSPPQEEEPSPSSRLFHLSNWPMLLPSSPRNPGIPLPQTSYPGLANSEWMFPTSILFTLPSPQSLSSAWISSCASEQVPSSQSLPYEPPPNITCITSHTPPKLWLLIGFYLWTFRQDTLDPPKPCRAQAPAFFTRTPVAM